MKRTRAQKAVELKRLITEGPSFGGLEFMSAARDNVPPEVTAKKAVQRWLDSWVAPLVEDLIPELKKPEQ